MARSPQPPRVTFRIVRRACVFAVIFFVPIVLLGAVTNTSLAILFAISTFAGLNLWATWNDRRSLYFVGLSAALIALAVYDNGNQYVVPLLIAGAALMTIASSRVSAGMLDLVIVAVTVAGITHNDNDALVTFCCVLLGFMYAWIVARLLKITLPRKPIPNELAVAHGFVLAAVAGLAAWATIRWSLPHGYWFIIAFIMVMRPHPQEGMRKTEQRLIGTLLGSLGAVIAAAILPSAVVGALVLFAIIAQLCYLLVGDYLKQTIYLTISLLLALSAGTKQSSLELSLERFGWTLLAAGSVVAIYFLFDRLQSKLAKDNPHEDAKTP